MSEQQNIYRESFIHVYKQHKAQDNLSGMRRGDTRNGNKAVANPASPTAPRMQRHGAVHLLVLPGVPANECQEELIKVAKYST